MLRKILIGVAIALPLVYGGAKLYVAHSIGDAADKITAMLAPVADIKYQGTTSSLFGGMVGLTGVTVHSLRDDNFYRIGAIKIRSDSIFALMGLDIVRGRVPKTFDVELDDLSMPLSGELLDKAHGDLGLMGDLHTPFGVLGCGDRSGFSESDLAQMGIDQITTGMNMAVRREPAQNAIRMTLHVDTPGVNAVDAAVSLVAPAGVLSARSVTRHAPLLKSLTFAFRDQGWHARVAKFCTAQTGMTRTAYLAAHVAAVKAALARMGFRVGNDLFAAYRRFLGVGGSMQLAIAPQSPVDLSTLDLYTVQEAIDYLAPTLQVNGRMVKRLQVARIKTRSAPSTMADVAAAATSHGSYREIPFDSLRRYVGRRVRLTTYSDHVFAGRLLSMGERTATVDVNDYGESDRELVLLSQVAKTELLIPAGRSVH